MFALPGIIALIVFTYTRPQEFVEGLEVIPFLYIFLAMAIGGMALDFATGRLRLNAAPQLRPMLLFYGFGLFAAMRFSADVIALSVTVTLYFLLSQGIQSLRGFRWLVATIFAMGMFCAVIGVHQGLSPSGCLVVTDKSDPYPDGRGCESWDDCRNDPAADPEAEYACERIGLFKSTSIQQRVRWRGVLCDPNELALTVGIIIPFAFAFFETKRSFFRLVLLIVTVVLVGTCVVFTQSRGGQVVVASVLGAYFVKKYGWKGAVLGAVACSPLLLLGGRDDEASAHSSEERVECMVEALNIWKAHPVLGCGYMQFTEHHFLTAHNAYLLAFAELGPVGFIIWASMLYRSMKIPLAAMKYPFGDDKDGAFIKSWSMTILASFVGILCGIFFLSFTYHYVLWIFFGTSGALYSAIKRYDPKFKIEFGMRDIVITCIAAFGLIVLIYGYTKYKGH